MQEKAVLRYLSGDSPAHINGHMTYIEKWFVTEILEKYNVLECFDVVSEYCEKPYFLDFAFPMLKVGFEMDGMFHVRDPKHIEHDKKRDAYLRSIGWTIYRFNYDQIKKETETTIHTIMSIINSLDSIKIGLPILYKYKEYKQLLTTSVGELVQPLD